MGFPFELFAGLVFALMLVYLGVRVWTNVMLAKERRKREEREREREAARDAEGVEAALRRASEEVERSEL